MNIQGCLIYSLVLLTLIIINLHILKDDIRNLYQEYETDNSIELTTYKTPTKRTANESYTNYKEIIVPLMPTVERADFIAMLRVVARYLVPVFMIFNGVCSFVLLSAVCFLAVMDSQMITAAFSGLLLSVECVGFGLYIALLKYNKEIFKE